jgi:hypothetical protein
MLNSRAISAADVEMRERPRMSETQLSPPIQNHIMLGTGRGLDKGDWLVIVPLLASIALAVVNKELGLVLLTLVGVVSFMLWRWRRGKAGRRRGTRKVAGFGNGTAVPQGPENAPARSQIGGCRLRLGISPVPQSQAGQVACVRTHRTRQIMSG